MIRLTLKRLNLLNPIWSPNVLRPGQEATLRVEAPDISASDIIRFEVLRGAEILDILTSQPGKNSVKWTALNLTGNHNLTFRASRIEKPSPENGHSGVQSSVTSGNAFLQGYSAAISSIDACFVPKQERLNAAFTIADAGAGAKKGRFEIWGERYPGASPAPLYTEDFSPSNGPGTWTSWDGKANAGHLKGKFITPEFSPYRLRLIIGPDSASVQDPYGAGQGKVAIAEAQFEIVVHSVRIRIQENIKEKAKLKEHKLEEVLAIEPRQNNGTYAAMGRLPKDGETGRVRVPMARHLARGESLDQGGNNVADPYMGGGGATKFAIDSAYYSRPELPIEFEPRLRSRNNAINNDANQRGLFEKEALGPLKIEPVAMEFYAAALYGGGAPNTDQVYFKKAAFRAKRGAHNGPVHSGAPGNSPFFDSWQARFDVTAPGTQNFNVSTESPDYGFTRGANELKVYLNRTRLDLSTAGDDSELTNGTKDYRELPAGGPGPATTIRLAPNKTEAGDVVWVIRTTGGGAAGWDRFPPGPNCHEHYGGVRGVQPTAQLANYFRTAFSADPAAPREPIVGKINGAYPYTSYIQLRPDAGVPQNEQERAEITAMESGATKGLAGAIFSPSYICGDQYELYGWVEHEPYERGFRFLRPKPRINGDKTGVIEIWRHLQFAKSLRMPLTATAGLGAGIGMGADGGAPYYGDGINMSISAMNGQYEDAFHEWTIPNKPPIHPNVDLKKYRKIHNLNSPAIGKVPLASNADIRNPFVRYDYYREELPPNIAFPNVAANVLAGVARGTLSPAAGADVVAALAGHAGPGDAALNPGVAVIPIYGGAPDDYFFQAFGRWHDIAYHIVDALTPRNASPRKMNVVRWADLHESSLWNDSAGNVVGTSGLEWEGECMGDGNSLFRASAPSATLFAHEMGHSTHLAHFVGMNFCWKHHNLNSPDCLMSYTFTTGQIWKRVGDVGPSAAGPMPGAFPWPLALGGTDVEHGWPHRDTNPGPPAALMNCIRYGANIALAGLCAKCLLKLRGWNEELLPVAWSHPDLF